MSFITHQENVHFFRSNNLKRKLDVLLYWYIMEMQYKIRVSGISTKISVVIGLHYTSGIKKTLRRRIRLWSDISGYCFSLFYKSTSTSH